MLFLGLLWSLVSIVVPVTLIVWIVRMIVRRNHIEHKSTRRPLSTHDILLTAFITAAGFTGMVGAYNLPLVLFEESAEGAHFAMRLVVGIAMIISGLVMAGITGKFLIVLGVFPVLMATPFLFKETNSSLILAAVVALVFLALIGTTIYISKKEEREAGNG